MWFWPSSAFQSVHRIFVTFRAYQQHLELLSCCQWSGTLQYLPWQQHACPGLDAFMKHNINVLHGSTRWRTYVLGSLRTLLSYPSTQFITSNTFKISTCNPDTCCEGSSDTNVVIEGVTSSAALAGTSASGWIRAQCSGLDRAGVWTVSQSDETLSSFLGRPQLRERGWHMQHFMQFVPIANRLFVLRRTHERHSS